MDRPPLATSEPPLRATCSDALFVRCLLSPYQTVPHPAASAALRYNGLQPSLRERPSRQDKNLLLKPEKTASQHPPPRLVPEPVEGRRAGGRANFDVPPTSPRGPLNLVGAQGEGVPRKARDSEGTRPRPFGRRRQARSQTLRDLTGYRRTESSWETMILPSTLACATNARSNGSLWRLGRRSSSRTCSWRKGTGPTMPLFGNWSTILASVAPPNSSFPNWLLICISQRETPLTASDEPSSFNSAISGSRFPSPDNHQSRTWVSRRN